MYAAELERKSTDYPTHKPGYGIWHPRNIVGDSGYQGTGGMASLPAARFFARIAGPSSPCHISLAIYDHICYTIINIHPEFFP